MPCPVMAQLRCAVVIEEMADLYQVFSHVSPAGRLRPTVCAALLRQWEPFMAPVHKKILYLSLDDREPVLKGRIDPLSPSFLGTERVWIDAQKDISPRKIHEEVIIPHNLVTVLVSAVLVLVDFDAEPKKASMGILHESSQVDAALGCATTSGEIDVERLIPYPVESGKPLNDGVYPLDFFGFGANLGGTRIVREQIGEAVGAESVVFAVSKVSALSGMLAVPKTNLGSMAISAYAPSLFVFTDTRSAALFAIVPLLSVLTNG